MDQIHGLTPLLALSLYNINVYFALRFLGNTDGMPWRALQTVLLSALLWPAIAVASEPSQMCADAAVVAERNWNLPTDLIKAIGRVESGRRDVLTGRVTPWPWTVNANGNGFWFASRTEAIDFVQRLQSQGVRLIDVGCFQIDLFYHPAAFSSLEQAFDPDANADYAGRFLTELRNRTGSWQAAVAGYHSSQVSEGESYRRKVMDHWGTGMVLARASAAQPSSSSPTPPAGSDRFVVIMSAAARAIPVIRP